jgi:hypothetical protein
MEKARTMKLFQNGNSEPNGHIPEHHSRTPSVVGSIVGGQGAQYPEGADDVSLLKTSLQRARLEFG